MPLLHLPRALWAALATLLLASPALHAQESPRNQFDFGLGAARIDTEVRASGVYGAGGTWLSGEDDLGLSRWSASGSLGYRRLVGQNWHFGGEYLVNSRTEDHTLPRDATIRGTSYAAGTSVRTRLEFALFSVTAGYAFVNDGATRVGVELGGYGLGTRLQVRTRDGNGRRYDESAGDAVPLAGVFASSALSDKLRFEGLLRYGQASGSRVTEARVQALWRVTPMVEVGGGWRHAQGRLSEDRDDFFDFEDTQLRFKIGGPHVAVRLAF